jgi:hypothetical protein
VKEYDDKGRRPSTIVTVGSRRDEQALGPYSKQEGAQSVSGLWVQFGWRNPRVGRPIIIIELECQVRPSEWVPGSGEVICSSFARKGDVTVAAGGGELNYAKRGTA